MVPPYIHYQVCHTGFVAANTILSRVCVCVGGGGGGGGGGGWGGGGGVGEGGGGAADSFSCAIERHTIRTYGRSAVFLATR
jgi:hypothetical protein